MTIIYLMPIEEALIGLANYMAFFLGTNFILTSKTNFV